MAIVFSLTLDKSTTLTLDLMVIVFSLTVTCALVLNQCHAMPFGGFEWLSDTTHHVTYTDCG